MKYKEIIGTIDHRSEANPAERWKYYQEWNRCVFLHWKVDADYLKGFLPDTLELDLIDGQAWISLVAFTMNNISFRNIPPFSMVSDFLEVNVRTYVKRNGEAGVYFLSMEAGKRVACYVAKAFSGLPYRFSLMKRGAGFFRSENLRMGDSLELKFSTGRGLGEKTAVERWLLERYHLFQDTKNGIQHFPIHHIEWPLRSISLQRVKVNYPTFRKLTDGDPVLAHYSPGVKVLAWPPRLAKQ
ncbi:YqjF family protein [Echinicola pacifica]|uniref:YqjF family protein n=1 Tax=Echinicola pacifica TaxID=346377 RepID=UPI00039DBAF0|nr:DUF2071 domain-containing protein [Echinicola pacifica]